MLEAFKNIGYEVDYNPTGGGPWRIFYCDTSNKYLDGAGTIYIKRDCDELRVIDVLMDSLWKDGSDAV